MNRRQRSQLAMGQAVLGFLDQDTAVWNVRPAFLPVVSNVRSVVEELVALSQKQEENNTPGFTRTKDQELEKLVDGTLLLSAQLRAFGKAQNNQVLLESVRHPKSAFDIMGAQVLLQTSRIIIDHARTNLADLGDYGVTETNVSSLESAHAQMSKLINQRDVAGGTRKFATDTIPELLTMLRDKLEHLDDLVDSLINNQEWENIYYNMRKIIDRGGRTSTPAEEQN